MWKRFPAKNFRPYLFGLIAVYACLLIMVAVNLWAEWIAPKRAILAAAGILLSSFGGVGLLIGAIYREIIYVKYNYADFYTSPWEFWWGMATYVFAMAWGICALVSAVTGLDALAWMSVFSKR